MTSHHSSHHITSTAFMTSHTLYMTSHRWQPTRYICHATLYIWDSIQCICFIKPSVSIIPHPALWMTSHTSIYDIMFSMHDITLTLYDITPLYVWHHTQYIYDMVSNICDVTRAAFMTTQRPYLTSHPLYLTSQALYLYHHTDDTHICIDVSLFRWHRNKDGSQHTCHMCDVIHTTWHHIHTLWNQGSVFMT